MDTSADEIDVTNRNVRIVLSRDYTNNELMGLRSMLTEKGALSVKWQKMAQEEDKELQVSAASNMGDGTILFQNWLAHDKPVHLDKDTLTLLNKLVVEEGMERLSSTEEPDGESA